MVAVGADAGVVEGHLQLIHRLQEQPLALVLQVLEGGLLQHARRLSGGQKNPCAQAATASTQDQGSPAAASPHLPRAGAALPW